MNQEQQIIEINTISKATLGVSKIHGLGVFAIRDIMEGEPVYADRMPRVYSVPFGSFGKLYPEVRKIILERWPSVVNGSRFIYPDARLVSFMNHSPDPNYNPLTDRAIRDIPAEAEILENYRAMKNWQFVFPDLPNWEKHNNMKVCPQEFTKGSLVQKSIEKISHWPILVKDIVMKQKER